MQTHEKPKSLKDVVAGRVEKGIGTSTVERVLRSWQAIDISATGVQRISQAPLDRLFARKVITQPMYDAGDRYREDAYLAGMVFSQQLDYDVAERRFGPKTPAFMANRRLGAYKRWADAQQALGHLAGVVDELIIADAGTTLEQIGARLTGRPEGKAAGAAAVELVKVALRTLVTHYEGPRQRPA